MLDCYYKLSLNVLVTNLLQAERILGFGDIKMKLYLQN